MAYKVFTNGSTLQASELNENLMQQATAVFSNAAARTAAITSPVEGQLTYLEDVNLYQHWSGSDWVSPFGLTLLANTVFTTASSVAVDNVFTSEFENYKVIINIDSNTTSNQPTFLFRTSVPGDLATTTTSFAQYSGGTTVSSYGGGGSQLGPPMSSSATHGSSYDLTIFQPNQSSNHKHFSGTFSILSSTAGGQWVGGFVAGWNSTASSATGFRFAVSAGTMTGNVRVYGFRSF